MEKKDFLEFGNATLEYVTNYLDSVRERPRVSPAVEPGYLRSLIPSEAPQDGEDWKEVLKDMDRVIMPGMVHWQSPRFHGYYPTASSYPAVIGELMSSSIAVLGFSWMTCPAATELEIITLDWLGKAIGLPDSFLKNAPGSKGGGVIHGTAGETTLYTLFCARERILKRKNVKAEDVHHKLVAYSSDQTHSSVIKAGLLSGITMRLVESDVDYQLRGPALKKAIEEDKEKGLNPFYVAATLGTTNSCAFDNLEEIGDVCEKEGLWLHVDAAYAGAGFICEENRHWMKGIEKVDSFDFNPHKWLLVTFDCSTLWLKNASEIAEPFKIVPPYLKHDMGDLAPDFRHWQIPFGRRFRSLKLWFVMRIYGIKGLQAFIREQIGLCKEFENLMKEDDLFEIVTPATMGIICFRLKVCCRIRMK